MCWAACPSRDPHSPKPVGILHQAFPVLRLHHHSWKPRKILASPVSHRDPEIAGREEAGCGWQLRVEQARPAARTLGSLTSSPQRWLPHHQALLGPSPAAARLLVCFSSTSVFPGACPLLFLSRTHTALSEKARQSGICGGVRCPITTTSTCCPGPGPTPWGPQSPISSIPPPQLALCPWEACREQVRAWAQPGGN